MYDFNILAVIPAALFIASVFLILCYCIKNKTFNFEVSKGSAILMLLSILSVLVMFFIGLMASSENDYRTINSSKQEIAFNSSKKPIYDIVINNNDFFENSNVKYKIYLKSGKTKTVSPKIVHVNQSHQPYLKKEREQKIMHVLWLKFKGPIDTNYTLYLNDK